jgi:hypothetical protein
MPSSALRFCFKPRAKPDNVTTPGLTATPYLIAFGKRQHSESPGIR